MNPRCIGCQWRIPIKLGGAGIVCTQNDRSCPEWAVIWALRYTKNKFGKQRKSFVTDEELLEAMRL